MNTTENTIPWASYIESRAKDYFHTRIIGPFRHLDLTPATGDPGNTELYLTFIPMGYDNLPTAPEQADFIELLRADEGRGGPEGEFILFTQNNELCLLHNENN
jgi:hypothetical protein